MVVVAAATVSEVNCVSSEESEVNCVSSEKSVSQANIVSSECGLYVLEDVQFVIALGSLVVVLPRRRSC